MFTGMFAKMKGKGQREAKSPTAEYPKPTGDSDYDRVQRDYGYIDEQTDDYAGFPYAK